MAFLNIHSLFFIFFHSTWGVIFTKEFSRVLSCHVAVSSEQFLLVGSKFVSRSSKKATVPESVFVR